MTDKVCPICNQIITMGVCECPSSVLCLFKRSKYKWSSPGDWLMQKAYEWDEATLRDEFKRLIPELDSDLIQDIFQQDMFEDGYFDEIKE